MSGCRIGLTGGIACGKTAVSDDFRALGVQVIDADDISRSIVEPGQAALAEIYQHFGAVVLQADGRLDRAYLRQVIFAQPNARKALESILHPRIRAEMLRQANAVTDLYCILSIPLLYETRQMDLTARIVVVDCPLELQKQRLVQRDHLPPHDVENILRAQCTPEERLQIADDVIHNHTSRAALTRQVKQLHQFYQHWAASYMQKGS